MSSRHRASAEYPLRPCGVGFCVESPHLYVWDTDPRDAADTAAELLRPAAAPGETPGGR